MDMSGIYQITCVPTGRYYIGQSSAIVKRWASHRSELRHNYHKNLLLQHAWNKYTEKAFTFEVLIECSVEQLLVEETALLDLHLENPKCMNLLRAGAVGSRNYKHGPRDEKTRARLSEIGKSRTHTIEAKAKISFANVGERNGRARPVVIEWADGRVEEFGCITFAAQALGIKRNRLFDWFSGVSQWPQNGGKTPKDVRHLAGLSGRYVE